MKLEDNPTSFDWEGYRLDIIWLDSDKTLFAFCGTDYMNTVSVDEYNVM